MSDNTNTVDTSTCVALIVTTTLVGLGVGALAGAALEASSKRRQRARDFDILTDNLFDAHAKEDHDRLTHLQGMAEVLASQEGGFPPNFPVKLAYYGPRTRLNTQLWSMPAPR